MAKLKLESKRPSDSVIIPEHKYKMFAAVDNQVKLLTSLRDSDMSFNRKAQTELGESVEEQRKGLQNQLDSLRRLIHMGLIIGAFGFGAGILALVKSFIK